MDVSDAKRLQALETEDRRLKHLLTESLLENKVTREHLRKNGDRNSQALAGAFYESARLQRTEFAGRRGDECRCISISPCTGNARLRAEILRLAQKGNEGPVQENPDFVDAVKATGKKTFIIAGTLTSVCMAVAAISAVAEGYKVFAIIDASGTYSKMAQEITLARIVQARVILSCSDLVEKGRFGSIADLHRDDHYRSVTPGREILAR